MPEKLRMTASFHRCILNRGIITLRFIYNIFTSNTRTKEEHKIYLLSIEILILKICPTLRHNSQLKLLN